MTDTAFVNVGKKAGLELFRIEHMEVIKQSSINGRFNSGDAYILLSTTLNSGKLVWTIHFWIGKDSSIDEGGVAAFKAVELDELLGGSAIQYRECQEHESSLFLSYFKSVGGIEYLPGGVASGFNRVQVIHRNRLLHLKGKRTVRIKEVELSSKALNTGDVFVLDAGQEIFVYNGRNANKQEKLKGIYFASQIEVENEAKLDTQVQIIHVDKDDPHSANFWTLLGGEIEVTSSGLPDEDDEDSTETTSHKLFRIYEVGNDSTIQFEAVAVPDQQHYKRSHLLSGDVFLLDASPKLYLWVGKEASQDEKKQAFTIATSYMKQNNFPNHTPVERVLEGLETPQFKDNFSSWDPPARAAFGGVSKATEEDLSTLDVNAVLAYKPPAEVPVDDGKGDLQIWIIKGSKKVPVEKDKYGHFYSGDCYVLLYTYKDSRGKDAQLLYTWLGDGSSQMEQGTAALTMKNLDDELGGKPVQARVTQGKEPTHFLMLFRGKMIVYSGGLYNSKGGEDSTADRDGVALFLVRGTSALNTFAVQVADKTSSLYSSDVFLLVTPSHVYIWKGIYASDDEVTIGANIANILATTFLEVEERLIDTIQEGSEPDDFWERLGGRGEYSQIRIGDPVPRAPRMFHILSFGNKIEEIEQFEQDDLSDEEAYIIDCYTELFVWVGSQATESERIRADQVVQAFLNNARDGRSSSIPVTRLQAGSEPMMFTVLFPTWDNEYHTRQIFKDPYEVASAKLASMPKKLIVEQPETKFKLKRTEVNAAHTPAPPAAPVYTTKHKITLVEEPVHVAAVKAPVAVSSSAAPKPAVAPVTSASVDKPIHIAPAVAVPVPASSGGSSSSGDAGRVVYSLEALRVGLPDGVNPAAKEEYLSDEDFATLFQVTRDGFKQMPKWKRDKMKKEKGIF